MLKKGYQMALDRELTDLGLSSKEAKIYLALLELGTASAQAIARRADIVRPTTYVILETLARKGLAAKATGPDAKKMLFTAEAPERLEAYVRQQQQQLEQRRQGLARLLPELRSIHLRGEERPRVRLFEGKEGLRILQQEFVQVSSEPIIAMASEDELYELFPPEEFDQTIRSLRVQAGIHSRYIYVTAKGPLYTPEDDRAALRESRYLPKDKAPIQASFAIHGPILSIVSLKNKIIGVLIEHADIAESFRALFEFVWKEAEPTQARAQAQSQEQVVPLLTSAERQVR